MKAKILSFLFVAVLILALTMTGCDDGGPEMPDDHKTETTASLPGETTGGEPTGTQPIGTEPTDTEPTDTEPTDIEPTDTESIVTEPTSTEQTDTEPVGTEPTDTEPIDTEPPVDPCAKGHTEVVDQAVAPTCTETGLTQGTHCSVCGEILTVQLTIPAPGHQYDNIYDDTCNICGHTRDAACAHTNLTTIPAVASTCTATGLTEGKQCASCGDIVLMQTVVSAKGHTEVTDKAVESTCTKTGLTQGKHCLVCGEVLIAQTAIPAGHTEATDKAILPTCTANGLTQGTHCSVCGEVLISQAVVPAKGHTEITDKAVASTCTQTGLTEGKHCSDCGEVLIAQTVVPVSHLMENDMCTKCMYPYSPISICSVEDLKNISSDLNGKYILMCDINLGGAEWTPIGTKYSSRFKGVFYGNGHTVSNFNVTGDKEYAGFFGYNEGIIRGFGVKNFTINTSYEYGEIGGLVGYNEGKIIDSYATGNVKSYGSSAVGGLVGNNRGLITNSYSTGNIDVTSYDGYIGGLVGFNDDDEAIVINCYATGNVTATGYLDSYVGGLVGYNDEGTIINCYATGDVTATGDDNSYAGGLVGYNDDETITNCHRYSGQMVTGTTINTDGTAVDMPTLQSVAFQTGTLKWAAEVWNFVEGQHPTLKQTGTSK